MKRRAFLQTGLTLGLTAPAIAALTKQSFDQAAVELARAARDGIVTAAVLHVVQRDASFTQAFGKATNESMFLLGSISKPIAITALMTLFDQGKFKLDDPLKKFIPEFKGDRRDQVTIQHLLTHLSGLPDQLPANNELRREHAPLSEFVEQAIRTPLSFDPGSKYQYSSMAVLLATRVAEIISGADILQLTQTTVFDPLKMRRSAQGLGRFKLEDMTPVQTERAAPESGGGDPTAKEWDWNSPYWRKLGAPWGGTHASASDLALFLSEFLNEKGACVKPAAARLMMTNQNPTGLTPRGLGFAVGSFATVKGASPKIFGHTGSTGTIAWADPATQTICVVLTSLPAGAVQPHPREAASTLIVSGS